ncbi:MAG: DUF2249 domain-containing protein [Opitutaceae bacterium]|nr:DUF2249 domain-containing protein [Opitutaceae bacterium]
MHEAPTPFIAPELAQIPPEKIFDVRVVSCALKHAQIFQRWAELPVGDFFVLVNDHRPGPLRAQFAHAVPGCFAWIDLVDRDGFAAVRIERLRRDPAGFEARAVRGCGGVPVSLPDDGVLARIEIDVRRDAAAEAGARVLRLAGSMPPWAELVAMLAERSPLLLRQLDLIGMTVCEEAGGDGWTCRVRVAGA